MDLAKVKQMLETFTKEEFLKKKITWEEAREMVLLINTFKDETGQALMDKVRALDDNNKKFTPIVFKILGEWEDGNG